MKKTRRFCLLIALCVTLIGLLVFGACASDPTGAGSKNEPTAISIINKPTEELYYQAGGVIALDYEITPADAIAEVEWTSSNKEVATIRANGRVSHRGIGETTISIKIKDTDISDSFVLKLIGQPALKISLNGAEVNASYSMESKNLASATLELAEDDDKKVVFDTNDTEVVSPAVWLGLPQENMLKAETVYKLKYTLQFASSSADELAKIACGTPEGSANDWWHVFVYNNLNAKTTDAIVIDGVCTTSAIKLDKIQLFAISENDFNWKGAFSICNVEISELVASDVTSVIEGGESKLTFEQDKEFTWFSGLQHTDDNQNGNGELFSHGGILRQWSSSNEEVIEHFGEICNGTFKIVGVGTTTITATVLGIDGFAGASLEVTVSAPAVVEDVKVTLNGETASLKTALTAQEDVTWSKKDFSSCIAVTDGKITIDGADVSNPTNAVYRCIDLVATIPQNALDASKTYTISYTVNILKATLKAGESLDFRVGGGAEDNKKDLYSNIGTGEVSVSGTLTLDGDGNAYIFQEANVMCLKDLKLEIGNIVIAEKTADSETPDETPSANSNRKLQLGVAGESVEGTVFLTAQRDDTWATEEFDSCVSVSNGKIVIDGTQVKNPSASNVYRYIELFVALPENTFDKSKTYTISYTVNIKEATLKDGSDKIDFRVGGGGEDNKKNLYVSIGKEETVSGTLTFNTDGNAYIFHETNMMCLKGLKLEISDIVIAEKQANVETSAENSNREEQQAAGEIAKSMIAIDKRTALV